ncbi:MAG TPA: hypothetical protein VLL52_05505 [Anaerolineae bacterium]|nr:hypothetical protein [Anaerolineae bacterium]
MTRTARPTSTPVLALTEEKMIEESISTLPPPVIWRTDLARLKRWVLQKECDYPCFQALVADNVHEDEIIDALILLQEQKIITDFEFVARRSLPYYALYFGTEYPGGSIYFDQSTGVISAIHFGQYGSDIALKDIFAIYGESAGLSRYASEHGDIVYFDIVFPYENIYVSTVITDHTHLYEARLTPHKIVGTISFYPDGAKAISFGPHWIEWKGYCSYGYYLNIEGYRDSC